jgi:antitoxin ParD1/3/4
MHSKKLSISLPQEYCDFLEDYQATYQYKSRSEVIQKALHVLRQTRLEYEYQAANVEFDSAFDVTASDGLDTDEAW